MGYYWRLDKKSCPCGGRIEHYTISGDCRGNPGIAGIECQSCRREFTQLEIRDLPIPKITSMKMTVHLRKTKKHEQNP